MLSLVGLCGPRRAGLREIDELGEDVAMGGGAGVRGDEAREVGYAEEGLEVGGKDSLGVPRW